jgi:hypothetical protein
MIPKTWSKSGDELLKEQQKFIVTKMKEYIFERKWYQDFGDIVFVLIMRALNLKIILFNYINRKWTIRKIESEQDSTHGRRCIYLMLQFSHYNAIVFSKSSFTIQKIK